MKSLNGKTVSLAFEWNLDALIQFSGVTFSRVIFYDNESIMNCDKNLFGLTFMDITVDSLSK